MRGKTPPTEPLSAGERRRLVVGIAVVAVLIAVGVTVWALFDHRPDYSRSENGCVTVLSAGTMGGQQQRACGERAREWCRSVSGQGDDLSLRVQEQCRRVGIIP
ncbi:hypothetical protein [Nocardia seriolae]|uniref:DSBA oxidoreductase n=1 Tax=Nocardia seriolae TaxID=37332 RepID=A0A0B8NJP8_9NOCA|nr:hypothetical protein [Nocardia seriolae]APB00595.1 hypothetical protein NS506_06564 [Nocardia seriolae]MTJ61911.1 hypothetical protein [Nocardia seriolae]MTJ74989.1 hypothetical protein [Nocardia seriolae]MTJ90060.1 hypothetical protein [Nocardia seriolae]MTK34033.1 hypothetical protein [Nocardia seriolae]